MMAQACEASRLSLYASAVAAAIASTKVAALANAKCACTDDDLTAALAWQLKRARKGRAKRGTHSSRKDEHQACASAPRTPNPQQSAPASGVHDLPPPYTSSENSGRAPAKQAKSTSKPRAIMCFKCGGSGHVTSACSSDARPPRKCYACGGIGHIARDCVTRAAQAKATAQTSSSTLNVVASARKVAAKVFASAAIAGVRIADALIDTGSAFLMLSSAMYATARRARNPAVNSRCV